MNVFAREDKPLGKALIPLIALAIIPVLLSLKFGGYHPRHGGWVFLLLALAACVQVARGHLRALRSVFGFAAVTFFALAAWTLLSLFWVDASTHDAWVESVRTTGYAAAFLLGGTLLFSRRRLGLFALVSGASIALLALFSLLRMAFSSVPLTVFVAGRLDWPVGYAPGLAALYVIGFLLLFGAAIHFEERWRGSQGIGDLLWSSLAGSGAFICAALVLLAQSRGALPAFLIALVVLLLFSANRVLVVSRLLVFAATLVLIYRSVAAVYQTQFAYRQAPFTEDNDLSQEQLLDLAVAAAHKAAQLTLITAIIVFVIGAALVFANRILDSFVQRSEESLGFGLAIPVVSLLVALGGALLILAPTDRSPTSWAKTQITSCLNPVERTVDPGSSTSYFSTTGTGRCDYYRVALLSAKQAPIAGLGAGNFRSAYVRERATVEEPRVVHSLPLQFLAELGVVGFALGTAVFGSALFAVIRLRRASVAFDPLLVGACAAFCYWLVHAGVDWLWQLPAVTLPLIVIAGGFVGCVSAPQRRTSVAVSAPFAAAGILAALALFLPPTMADAELRRARDPQLKQDHPKQALEAARLAHNYDPKWAEPLIAESAIYAETGDTAKAADAARRAIRVEPRSWSVQYRASGLIGLENKVEGRSAFVEARRLNPKLPAVVTDTRTAQVDPDAMQIPDNP